MLRAIFNCIFVFIFLWWGKCLGLLEAWNKGSYLVNFFVFCLFFSFNEIQFSFNETLPVINFRKWDIFLILLISSGYFFVSKKSLEYYFPKNKKNLANYAKLSLAFSFSSVEQNLVGLW